MLYQKKVFMIFVRKFVGKSRTKTFRANLGEIGQKSFPTPKFVCSYTSGQKFKTLSKIEPHNASSNAIFDHGCITSLDVPQENTRFMFQVITVAGQQPERGTIG